MLEKEYREIDKKKWVVIFLCLEEMFLTYSCLF